MIISHLFKNLRFCYKNWMSWPLTYFFIFSISQPNNWEKVWDTVNVWDGSKLMKIRLLPISGTYGDQAWPWRSRDTTSRTLSFQDQHNANSFHVCSSARYKEFGESKGSTGQREKTHLLHSSPSYSQGCCSLQRALADSAPAPGLSRHDKCPSAGQEAEPALPVPGRHASSSLGIQILPLARSLLTLSFQD